MERVFLFRVTVWKGKIDPNRKLNFAATEYVLKEAMPLVKVALFEIDFLLGSFTIFPVENEFTGAFF